MDPCLAAAIESCLLIILFIVCAYYYLGVCGAGVVIAGLGIAMYVNKRAYTL